MASNSVQVTYQTRRQILTNLALKQDLEPPKSQQVVRFADQTRPLTTKQFENVKLSVNELPTLNTHFTLPESSAHTLGSRASNRSSNHLFIKKTSSKISSSRSQMRSIPIKTTTTMSPLIPLLGTVLLILILATSTIFLPPYLLSLRTNRSNFDNKVLSNSIPHRFRFD